MQGQIEPIRDFSGGMVTAVNDALMPGNAVRLLQNCFSDEAYGNQYGNIMSRPGYTSITDAAGSGMKGLTFWLNPVLYETSPTTAAYLVEFLSDGSNVRAYYKSGRNAIQIGSGAYTTWSNTKKVRSITFLNLLFAVNGFDPVRVWNGDVTQNWSSTNVNVTGAPIGSLIENFQDAPHISGIPSDPSAIWPASIPSGSPLTITWSADNVIRINPDDNDRITAIANAGGVMAVWKRHGFYTWNGLAAATDRLIDIGAPNQECVQTMDSIAYFFGVKRNGCGFYQFPGEVPVDVGRTVQEFWDAINPSFYDSIVTRQDQDAVYVYIGTVTVRGKTYTNCEMRLCVSKGTWSVNTLGHVPVASLIYDNGAEQMSVFGTSDGKVMEWASGTSDDGAPIEMLFNLGRKDFGIRQANKEMYGLNTLVDNNPGLSLSARVDRDSDFVDLGSSDEPSKVLSVNVDLSGKEIEFQGSAMLMYDRVEFAGIELTDYRVDPLVTE